MWWGLAFWFIDVTFSCVLTLVEEAQELPRDFFIRALSPFKRVLPSWPNHLLTPSPWEWGQHMNLAEGVCVWHKYWDHSRVANETVDPRWVRKEAPKGSQSRMRKEGRNVGSGLYLESGICLSFLNNTMWSFPQCGLWATSTNNNCYMESRGGVSLSQMVETWASTIGRHRSSCCRCLSTHRVMCRKSPRQKFSAWCLFDHRTAVFPEFLLG
jgi:hypothetical protein